MARGVDSARGTSRGGAGNEVRAVAQKRPRFVTRDRSAHHVQALGFPALGRASVLVVLVVQRSPLRFLTGATAIALALTVGEASPLRAQQRGTIVGTVVDELTGEGLEGAKVSLLGIDLEAITDTSGVFEIAAVPAGDLAARVEVPGYAAMVEQIEVLPDEVVLFQFYVSPLEVAIQGLIVGVQARRAQGASVTELRRGERSQTALDLLREKVPGVMVRTSLGAETGIRVRGSSSLYFNDPSIYLDGILVGSGGSVSAVHTLEQIPAERVLRIRVLHGPSASARYGDSAGGVILVETR
jgi:outer membrane receptor protein involved in Fe transport